MTVTDGRVTDDGCQTLHFSATVVSADSSLTSLEHAVVVRHPGEEWP